MVPRHTNGIHSSLDNSCRHTVHLTCKFTSFHYTSHYNVASIGRYFDYALKCVQMRDVM